MKEADQLFRGTGCGGAFFDGGAPLWKNDDRGCRAPAGGQPAMRGALGGRGGGDQTRRKGDLRGGRETFGLAAEDSQKKLL